MSDACSDCKFFRRGEAPTTRAVVLAHAISGRWISPSLLSAAALGDKDGSCVLMPEPIQKRKTDWCGQFQQA